MTPLEIVAFLFAHARHPANEKNTLLVPITHLHKPQHEDVSVSADDALDGQISEFSIGMCHDLVVFGLNEMVDDMGGNTVFSFVVAEPLGAGFGGAFDNRIFVLDSAVGAGVRAVLLVGAGGGLF